MLYIKTKFAAGNIDPANMACVHEGADGIGVSVAARDEFNAVWRDCRATAEQKEKAYARYRAAAFSELKDKPSVLDLWRRLCGGEDIVLIVDETTLFPCSRRRLYVELFHSLGVPGIITDHDVPADIIDKLSELPALGPIRHPEAIDSPARAKPVFDAKAETDHIVSWIRQWFAGNAPDGHAVIGISGGKDSTVAAALLAKALGHDHITGVLMPDGVQADLDDSKRVVKLLGINAMLANISPVTTAIRELMYDAKPIHGLTPASMMPTAAKGMSRNAAINMPPRVRMAVLYAIGASLPNNVPGFVCNTCNLSEDWIGYSTKYGDAAGDFAPLAQYTVTEVIAIGRALGLPADLIDKTPSDGLCGMSDEDRFGFTYAVLDEYIRTGKCADPTVRAKIDKMHIANLHKLRTIPSCPRLAV